MGRRPTPPPPPLRFQVFPLTWKYYGWYCMFDRLCMTCVVLMFLSFTMLIYTDKYFCGY